MKKILIFLAVSAFLINTAPAGTKLSPSRYKDGVYTGTGQGYGGEIILQVFIKNGRIKNIQAVKQNESSPGNAFSDLKGSIIVAQGVENIDAVSGATITSKGIFQAVANALEKAEGKTPETENKNIIPATEKNHLKKSMGAIQVAPTPVWVIGSYDKNGRPNVMTAAWAGICCSNPPAVTVSLRKATYTYGNIMAKKAFTVNIPSVDYIKQTDYYGIASGKNTDKFQVTALTPVKSELVDAPYIKQFPIVLECKLIHSYDIGLHTMFVGQIMDVKADEFILDKDGKIDMGKLNSFIYSPTKKQYHKTGEALGEAFSIGRNYEDISRLMLQPKPNALENNK